MARGPKKHLKRLHAPRSWMLSKMAGIFAPRPSTGPHKMRESIPLIIILRNRLKYALNGREVQAITMNRHVMVDGRVRTDTTFPTGFMDVVSIPKTGEHFRILYDVKGRFAVHPIPEEEAKFKLCKVVKVMLAKKGIPFLVTHDGRTIRYPDPAIKAKDTIKLDLETNKIVEHVKFEVGNLCMITGGRNIGRVGLLNDVEHHEGSPDIVHVKDAANNVFATRVTNLFVLGSQGKSLVTLPKRKGLKKTIAEDREYRLKSGK